MHIPDSAISPATSLACGAAMLPVWTVAGRSLRANLGDRQAPLLAIGAAFCFTIMMFNVPAPGGTTVHPTGAVLLAILLGPAAAVIGMTVALVIQALFFGDGGVLALGANAFTMAFAMPLCGYAAYRAIAGRSETGSARRFTAAGAGAYIGLNAAALLTALFLGIQPALFHSSAGRPQYFPFGLSVTIPALMSAHLLIAGFAEAAVTVAALRYVAAAGIGIHSDSVAETSGREGRRHLLWVGLAALAAVAPLGLLARGEAWGEWDAAEIQRRAGFVPRGFSGNAASGWHGFQLLPDYLSDLGAVGYVFAALAGITFVALAAFLLSRLLRYGAGRGEPAIVETTPAVAHDCGGIPAWLLVDDSTDEPAAGPSRGSSSTFLDRTLESIAANARDALAAERWSRTAGLLQRVDPRVKIITTLVFIVLSAITHRAATLLVLYAIALACAVVSRIPLSLVIRRVWLAVPLFAGFVALPAALNVVTPGRTVLVLSRDPLLAVTDAGAAVAAMFTLRTGVALTFALLLTLTTPWNRLLEGLRVLRISRPFLVVAAMTYRYLTVLMTAASDLFVARRSRTIGNSGPAERRRFVGRAVGALFGKSVALTDEVHSAMLSRGWTGEPRSLESRALHRADYAWMAGTLAIAACLAGGEFLARFRP